MTSVRQGIEVELKYRVRDQEAAARLGALRTLGSLRVAGRPRQVQIEDRHLDTADGALTRAGYAARLRRGPRMTILSVKASSEAASALHRREELEGPADLSLDPHAWPSSAARSLVLEHAGDAPLLETITIRQLRHARTFAGDALEVELSVDDVEVVAGGRMIDRFLELEVELKSGDERGLAGIAAVLGADDALEPVTTSKLERALAALARGGRPARSRSRAATSVAASPVAAAASGAAASAASPSTASPAPPPTPLPNPAPPMPGSAPSPEPAPGLPVAPEPERPADATTPPVLAVGKTPGVTRDDLLAEAGRKVLRFHLARMLAREEGTRTGVRIEDLHGMRVATRRMRAAWRVFGDGFRLDRTRRMRRRLRVLAARLGAVRDLDVLIEAAQAHQATLPDVQAAAFDPLVRAWAENREIARQLMVRELDSGAYTRLVDEYRIFVTSEGAAVLAPASPVSPHRVRDTAGSRIWLAYEQVRGYESVLRWADIETIHQLRIAAKWLRYTLEFFREALGPEVDQLVPRVVALQDHLGWLHDADVTIALTRQFLVANAGRLATDQTEVIAAYLEGRERELERLRRTIGAPWRGVNGVAFRRLLGRAVSGL
ncbi:MAG TPA: CHAD domain-containing protein [Verrucomicrobiae bacterium]|nr:CHAD domain-containing protein [Verrucomicrobiae bacterium]